MLRTRVANFFLCGGIDRDDYDSIRTVIWKRNLKSLRITASLAAALGAVFLIYNLLRQSGNQLPYGILLAGGLLSLLLIPPVRKRVEKSTGWAMVLCYALMILICGYATFLSMEPVNAGIPATSAIVFIALLPLTIDDRPVRMFLVMLSESVVYLLLSRMMKTHHAFSLDVMNVATFCLVGMILYAVICTRNILELVQGSRIEQMSIQTIQTLANAIDAKDSYTKGHSTRVSRYAVMMAEELGWGQDRIRELRYAALLHDIGKIGVPDSILNKPGRLTGVEYDIIKSHTTMGEEILRERKIVDMAEDVAFCHHERYDGMGYPRGLRGEEISEEARIIGIADAFDAMSSNRIYRKACDGDYIRQQLLDGRGKQFDPEYVDALIRLWDRGCLEENLRDASESAKETQAFVSHVHEAVDAFVSGKTESENIAAKMKENGHYEGAMGVEYSHFPRLYEFIGKLEKRFGHPFRLILITMERDSETEASAVPPEKAMFLMERAIQVSIRDVDIVTRYSAQQFLVILTGADSAGVRSAVDRIFKSYFRMSGSIGFSPSYSIVETAPETT